MATMTLQQALDLAVRQYRAGQLPAAQDLCRQILIHQPNHSGAIRLRKEIAAQCGQGGSPEALIKLGDSLRAAGQLDQAIAAYHQAIACHPEAPGAYRNLGIALYQKGEIDEAIVAYRSAIAIEPRDADAHVNLGVALYDRGALDDAVGAYRDGIALNPISVEAHVNLGNALQEKGQLDEAIAAYLQALKLNPQFPQAHRNLGLAFKRKGELDQAVAAYRQAIAFKPDYAEAYNSLGRAFCDMGLIEEAIAAYRQAIVLRPEFSEGASNILMALHYQPGQDMLAIATAHRQWNLQYAEPLKKFIRPCPNDLDPQRRLRIGYVSPDFRDHPVGRFLLPLLEHHDTRQVEVFAYHQSAVADAVTHRLRSCTHCWRSIVGLSDAEVAELIRKDQVDLLVDLTMHTADNRLLVFARKPAPVQVTYLAYCSTTGLETIDYRLSDPYLDPPQEDESQYSERTIRLPQTFWCYQPHAASPEVGPLPALENGHITFGCLNNFCKVSEPALATWIALLQQLPTAQLLLHAKRGSHRQRVRERFEREGVDPERLRFAEMVTTPEYFRLYREIDIALDTTPYGGGTTTCDALWMGVPVVSLVGKTAVGRGGLSILSNVGIPELAAKSTEEYLRIARELAQSLPRLNNLRSTLRRRMERSPLMDAATFARHVEAAYREMWRHWCLKRSPAE